MRSRSALAALIVLVLVTGVVLWRRAASVDGRWVAVQQPGSAGAGEQWFIVLLNLREDDRRMLGVGGVTAGSRNTPVVVTGSRSGDSLRLELRPRTGGEPLSLEARREGEDVLVGRLALPGDSVPPRELSFQRHRRGRSVGPAIILDEADGARAY